MRALPLEFFRPAKALPFDPVEFHFTLEWAQEMARTKAPSCDPGGWSLLLQQGSAAVNQLRFTDNYVNRFTFAVIDRYWHEPRKHVSFMCRWLALIRLLRSGALDSRFYHPGISEDDPDDISDNVIDLAATFPLGERGAFDVKAFLAELNKAS